MKSEFRTFTVGSAMLVAGLAIGINLPSGWHNSALAATAPAAAPAEDLLIPEDQHLWIIHAIDKPDMREKVPPTSELWKQHLAYDETREQNGLFLGGRVDDENGKREYGMFIFRAKNREDAWRIANEDPIIKAGWRSVTMHQYEVHQGRMNFSIDFSSSKVAFDRK